MYWITSFIGEKRFMNTKTKFFLFFVLIIAIPFSIGLSFIFLQKKDLAKNIKNDLKQDIENQIINIAKDVDIYCQVQYDLISDSLTTSLNIARELIQQHGGVTLLPESVEWTAVKHLTQKVTSVTLPKIGLNGKWIGKISDPQTKTPIVDDVTRITGNTCTIFQRMNKRGDMLVVATSVIHDGQHDIGTFRPAVNEDNSLNPIIQAVLNGQDYIGKAFILNQWYMSKYSPLRNKTGDIIGMLYAGIKTKDLNSIRNAIMSFKIKDSGYVFVLGGSGKVKGQYIISKDGKRDGENIWDSQDANGNYFIRDMINDGVKLKKGEVILKKYSWKNIGEKNPRVKMAAITYFEPWDWVIGASVYEEEFLGGYNKVVERFDYTYWALIIGGFVALLIALGFAIGFGKWLAKYRDM